MKRLLPFLALAFAFFVAVPLSAQDKKKGQIDDDVKKSTAKALEWLATKQNSDGSWGDARYPNNTAITGFVLMAYMSQGHVPNQGKYGPEVAKGARFLIASARESDGYLIGSRFGNMYCHGMASLALTQLFGMTGDEEIKKTLKRAIDLIVRSQSPDGGWRYEPYPSGSDISVTIMQVMALRGAKDSGLHVPDKTMKKALEYINECYDEYSGGYTYQPKNRQPGFARTAAGICVLKLVGEYDKKIDKSIEYLKKSMERPREHYWYGHYYACHAMYQLGGKDWEDYYTMIRKQFAETQQADGSWTKADGMSAGPVYQTAIAVLALSVPADYLPIFQR
jgi:Prenyltransferase and squalene oxidase repeat